MEAPGSMVVDHCWVEPDAHELGARLEQLHPLRQRARPLVERRGQLLEGSDGVVGLQLVLAVDDLQGEEARGQVVQPQQGDAEAHRIHITAQFGDLAGQRVKLLDALQDEGVDPLVALAHLLGDVYPGVGIIALLAAELLGEDGVEVLGLEGLLGGRV